MPTSYMPSSAVAWTPEEATACARPGACPTIFPLRPISVEAGSSTALGDAALCCASLSEMALSVSAKATILSAARISSFFRD
eukprot:scaffold7358_cov252-Pinguiococcus_pyrenoidosus.AAC.33